MLPASLRHSSGERGIVLNKLLLNPSDSVTMKFLLTNHDSTIQPSCRIAGIKKMENLEHGKRSRIRNGQMAVYVVLLILSLFFLLIIAPSTATDFPDSQYQPLITFFAYSFGGVGTLISLLVILLSLSKVDHWLLSKIDNFIFEQETHP
jgi:hypothetical protein